MFLTFWKGSKPNFYGRGPGVSSLVALRVAVRTSHIGQVEHASEVDVVDVLRGAGDQTRVFTTFNRLAHQLGQRSGHRHRFPSTDCPPSVRMIVTSYLLYAKSGNRPPT